MEDAAWLEEEPAWQDMPLEVSTADGAWRLSYGEIVGRRGDRWVLHDVVHERWALLETPPVARGSELLRIVGSVSGPFAANELIDEVRIEGLPLAD